MVNVLALGLVFTSLVTAGFFSPSPDKEKPKEAVIVKEGRRVVVVEYEDGDGNTKVSISPKDDRVYGNDGNDKLSAKMEDVKDEIHGKFRPTELVCDAYGKCKHVLARAMGKTREAVVEKAHGAADKVYDVKDEAVSKVKDAATDAAHKVSDKAQEVKDSADQVAGKAKDELGAKTMEMKEVPEKAKRGAEEVRKKVEEGLEREGGIRMEGNKEMAEEWVENAKKEGKKEISEILGRGGSVVMDVVEYVVSPLAWLRRVLHLMGVAVAYGMCVWVTFASSYVLGNALPKQQFAMVQCRIYPVYFKGMGYSVGMALLGHLMSGNVGVLQGLNLWAALVFTILNLVWVEPRATKVMFERMKKEKEEGGKEKEGSRRNWNGEIMGLSGSLQRLNSYSSILNVLTLMSLTWHLVHLSQFLHN